METLEKIHQGWDLEMKKEAAESEDAESAQQLPLLWYPQFLSLSISSIK